MRRRVAVFTSSVAIVVAALTLVPHLIAGNLVGGARPGSHEASARTCTGGYSYGYDGTTHNTFMILSGHRFTIVIGQRDTIFGKLFNQCPGGTPVPMGNRTIHMQRRLYPAPGWSEFTSLTTASDGSFSVDVNPVRNTIYRAVFLGAQTARTSVAPYNGSTSNWVFIGVRVGISIQPLNATTQRNLAITFSGKVVPSKAGKTIGLQIWDKAKGKWRFLARKVVLDANSNYSVAYVSRVPGKFFFRTIYATQDRLNFWNISRVTGETWT